MATIEVDVDLDDFDDQELLDEIKRRGLGDKLPKVKDYIMAIEREGRPRDILDQLHSWNRTKITTMADLQNWMRSCGVKQ